MNPYPALAIFLLSATAAASSPSYRNWSHIKLDSDSFSLELRTDNRYRRVLFLDVVQDGIRVEIPKSVYADVDSPLVYKLSVEACHSTEDGTCSVLELPFIDQRKEIPDDEAYKILSITFVGGKIEEYGIYRAPPHDH